VQVDGKPIERMAQLLYVLKSRLEGETLTVTVKRDDEELTRSLTLVAEVPAYESGFLGILPERSAGGAVGVRVRFVFSDSPAAKAQIESGDVITSLNQEAVATAAALLDWVSRLRPGEKIALEVERDGKSRTVEVELASIPESIPETLPASTVSKPEEPAEANGEKPKTGRFTAKLEGYDQEHWAYVPDDWSPNRTWSLLVWTHPTATSMEATIFNRWKSVCDHRGILLLAPESKSGRNWTENETEYVRDVVRDFSATYNVAADRIAIHGFDDGGVFAAQTAFEHRELFSGIILAGTGLREAPPENLPEFRQQLLLVSGSKDPITRLVELTAGAIRGLKYPVTQLKVDDLGHEYPKGESIEEMARWLDSLDRI